MANLYRLLTGNDGSVNNVALGGLLVVFYVVIVLYILFNSSLLPPIDVYA